MLLIIIVVIDSVCHILITYKYIYLFIYLSLNNIYVHINQYKIQDKTNGIHI
jgi:hypothetical protein